MNGALPFIAAAALLALTLGFVASRGKDMSLEQWTVGGRGFGASIAGRSIGVCSRPPLFSAYRVTPDRGLKSK